MAESVETPIESPLSAKHSDEERVVVDGRSEEQGNLVKQPILSSQGQAIGLAEGQAEEGNVEDDDEDEDEDSRPSPWWYSWLQITLVLTLGFSYLFGLTTGTIQFFKTLHNAKLRNEQYLQDADVYNRMDYFSLPGIPGIHEVGMHPYYIPHIQTPNWRYLMNLTSISHNGVVDDTCSHHIGALDNLYIKTGTDPNALHWVFVAPWGLFPDIPYADPWINAFNKLLQHRYAVPAAHNATIHYMQCLEAKYICSEWKVKAPGLMLFAPSSMTFNATARITRPGTWWWEDDEKEDPEPEPPLPGAVSVFYVDLPFPPIDQDVTGMPRPTGFPSHFEQLRFLTSLDRPWEWLLPHDEPMLNDMRLNEYMLDLETKYPALGIARKTHDFLEGWSLGIWPADGALLLGVAVSFVILGIDFVLYETAHSLFTALWHRFMASKPTTIPVSEPEPGRNWNDFFGEAIKGVFSLADEEKKKLEATTTGPNGQITSMPKPYMDMAEKEWQNAIIEDLERREREGNKEKFAITFADGSTMDMGW